jgi:hypothetical protein
MAEKTIDVMVERKAYLKVGMRVDEKVEMKV